MKIVLTGTIEQISTRLDGTIKLVWGTNEMDSTEASKLFELRGKFCKALLTDTGISPLEDKLLEETKIVDGKKVKTKSQRLRAVLFRVFELSGEPDFDVFYNNQLEIIIEHFKKKLD